MVYLLIARSYTCNSHLALTTHPIPNSYVAFERPLWSKTIWKTMVSVVSWNHDDSPEIFQEWHWSSSVFLSQQKITDDCVGACWQLHHHCHIIGPDQKFQSHNFQTCGNNQLRWVALASRYRSQMQLHPMHHPPVPTFLPQVYTL